jgi:glycine/D-amino acid oxidase-like deaminating enzyme
MINRRGALGAGLSAALVGCTHPQLAITPPASPTQNLDLRSLKPLDLSIDQLTHITVCTRPFRQAGPRLEAEMSADRLMVHNYGHGGSGWSLAWGYAEAARALIRPIDAKSVSVLGAGAIGLTSAIALAETGAKVTIFAREMPMESRSARATGVWSPSSRIALSNAAGPDFPTRWEALARRSYARHLQYVGRAGSPVEFTPRFYIRTMAPEPVLASRPEGADSFLHLDRRIRGITPPWSEQSDTPFPAPNGVRGGLVMTFNIAEYTRQLVQDFQAMGGRIVRADIDSLEELPGDAVINCAGYDAKTLVDDQSLTPVRGQIAWLAAQTDRLYGIIHRNVMALSRRDGLLIQETGGSDYFGLGDGSETPDRDEFLAAQAKLAPMFDWGWLDWG